MDVYHKILEKYWGSPAFRPLQEDIIHSVCAGKDTLGLMPGILKVTCLNVDEPEENAED